MDKKRLTRIVRAPVESSPTEGKERATQVVIDPTGKRNGRGAYLCDNPVCWDNAVKRNTLNSALKTELTTEEKAMILANRPVVSVATEQTTHV